MTTSRPLGTKSRQAAGTCASLELAIDRAAQPVATLVLAHGAGAGMDTPFMQGLAKGLSAGGVTVVRFEFGYMQRRRSEGTRAPPERMHALEARFLSVVRALDIEAPLFVAGKSMGSRVAARVADVLGARGMIAFGFPFHPPHRPERLRLVDLSALSAPALLVQGTRDPLGTREEVASYPLPPRVSMHWLADGDHSFAPRKRSGRTLAQNMDEAVEAALAFVRRAR